MTRPYPARRDPTARVHRLSLHIGVNAVDPGVFHNLLEPLSSAENDARAMRDLANTVGFATRFFAGAEATRDGVLASFETIVGRLVPGDELLVSFAGHGVTLRGIGIERDGWDEAWCVHDGILLDDEVHELLSEVPAECRVVFITDACFAEGMLDDGETHVVSARPVHPTGITRRRTALRAGPPERRSIPVEAVRRRLLHAAPRLRCLRHGARTWDPEGFVRSLLNRSGAKDVLTSRDRGGSSTDSAIAELVRSGQIPPGRFPAGTSRSPISATVVALAAAREGDLAYEGPDHGFFTATLLEVLERSRDVPFSYEEVMADVSLLVGSQRPTLGTAGRDSAHAGAFQTFASGGGGT